MKERDEIRDRLKRHRLSFVWLIFQLEKRNIVTDKTEVPGSGRSPGGGNGNPLQYSCLENPMDRGAWQATVHTVAKSRTQLKRVSMHTHI